MAYELMKKVFVAFVTTFRDAVSSFVVISAGMSLIMFGIRNLGDDCDAPTVFGDESRSRLVVPHTYNVVSF